MEGSQVETGGFKIEPEKTVLVVRDQSPVLENLSEEPSHVQRFAQITNNLIQKWGGGDIN